MSNPLTEHLKFKMDPRGNGGLMGSGRIPDDLRDSPEIQAMKIAESGSLRDLQREWRLFTAAPLVSQLYGLDPLQEWVNLVPDSKICAIKSDRPYFVGNLGPDTAHHVSTLYGCDIESWFDLRQYLSTMAFLDRDKGRALYAFWHSINIPDWMILRNMTVLPDVPPMVRVAVIGYSDGEKCWGMVQGKPPLHVPRLTGIVADLTDRTLAFNALNDIPLDPRIPGHPEMTWDESTKRFVHLRGIDDQSYDSEPARPTDS